MKVSLTRHILPWTMLGQIAPMMARSRKHNRVGGQGQWEPTSDCKVGKNDLVADHEPTRHAHHGVRVTRPIVIWA